MTSHLITPQGPGIDLSMSISKRAAHFLRIKHVVVFVSGP